MSLYQKATYKIPGMDCPSEERMIRMQLQPIDSVLYLAFDLAKRRLDVYHKTSVDTGAITTALEQLNMGASLMVTEAVDLLPGEALGDPGVEAKERRILWIVLVINFGFFVIEMTTGLISRSMGLVADSLDMLADAVVYALALFAVGGALATKKRVARFAGYFQIVLALIGFLEVVRRFIGAEQMPDFRTMIVVSSIALVANVVCLILLQSIRSNEAHIKASMIFTSNDVIINTGVIVAGVLVLYLNSSYPDLIIGGIVFLIVARGAWRILKLAR
jgi:Co/Zn/Cd efflux system component